MINYSKPTSIIPSDEEARLEKLQGYEILDTPSETDLDTIALLASHILETENAYINFVGKDSVFFKASSHILSVNETARSHSLCALTILEEEVVVFRDTRQVPGLADHPCLSGKSEVRFYAGAQLKTEDGYAIGTVCVTDTVPHLDITGKQLMLLKLLSSVVMEKLEIRLNSRKIARAYDETLHRFVHDMKNPVTSISLYAQLLGSKEITAEKVSGMAGKIEKSTGDITKILNTLLSVSPAAEKYPD